MDFAITLVLFAIFFIFALYLQAARKKPKNYPPGPIGIPILGHLPLLGLEPYKTAIQWKARYGPIVAVRFASYPAIIISDYKLVKEAMAQPAFTGRPKFHHAIERSGNQGRVEGINFAYGQSWREQRGFTQRRLKEIGGFGTRSMEGIIMQQVEELVQGLRVEAASGRPLSTHGRFSIAVVNALWSLLAGAPFSQNDPKLGRITRLTVDAIAETSVTSLLSMFMPAWFSNYFPRWITGVDGLERMYAPILEFLRPYIAEHWAQARGAGEEPRDFMDAYIDQIRSTTDKASSFHADRAAHSLPTVAMDLFLAGSETSGTTLQWICLLLASFPEVQRKLHTEIDSVLGHSEAPSLLHRRRMPYTEAVLHETLRFRPILPMGVFHSTMEPVQLAGYDIPEDTMVFVNVWEAHYNKDLWGDPENFGPERWLHGDTGEFVRREGFLAFSTGKRVCLGEQFARDEVFLFTVAIFQAFRIETVPGRPAPTIEPKLGGTSLGPQQHELMFRVRE